ncbi:chloride channel protein [Uliginosibacterium sp. 31-16]|uniref:chloride channel protein n=1 Tax=Uliginosibacterium sp. 31-16 TaxID=3068315 RepID=UPI00273E6AAE|nr:chloride channel protein [Uliginosibacterium sp. 31-16]MDP5237934.1 chloride channel protein [Uliginosibacterium sp. 31-16]
MLNLKSLREGIDHRVFTDPLAWRDRLLMWLAALCAGLCVVAFTFMTEWASGWFMHLRTGCVWLPLILTPLAGMLVVWLVRRYAEGSAGSGIPQVITAMSGEVPGSMLGRFVSLRVAVAKAVLGALALGGGFSSGREGPSVQIAAGVMASFQRGFSVKSHITANDLMLAGGAAGIAAAFNAPLAGVVFAIEELTRRFEQRSSGLIVTAIVLAGLVSVSVFGNGTYFRGLEMPSVSLAMAIPALACTLVSGLAGGLFSRLLIVSSMGGRDWFSRLRATRPVIFAGVCGLGVALLGLVSQGAAHGSGFSYTEGGLGGNDGMTGMYAGVKFVATWLSYWSGVPGGIFAPSLAIGAGLGHDVAMLMDSVAMPTLVALGMVGFLAAVTQAPITSFIIVMEMIDGHTMVLSLMATALVSALISRLISPPLYHSLSSLQLQKVRAQTPD